MNADDSGKECEILLDLTFKALCMVGLFVKENLFTRRSCTKSAWENAIKRRRPIVFSLLLL